MPGQEWGLPDQEVVTFLSPILLHNIQTWFIQVYIVREESRKVVTVAILALQPALHGWITNRGKEPPQ